MSLTQAQAVFAGVHEDAINDFLAAFCSDRPRYLVYGSPAFVPATSVSETQMQAINFPGVPGGIQWRLRLQTPRVDLFKQSQALPPELNLGPGQFSAEIAAELCIECRRLKIDPKPPRGKENQDKRRNKDQGRDERRHPIAELTCFKLQIYAIGHIEHVAASNGEDAIALMVDAVEIVDIKPEELEAFLECLMFMILQAVLSEIRLPLRALRVGAFQLVPVIGPLIEDDQIKMRGNL